MLELYQDNMEKILNAIEEQTKLGYGYSDLEVGYGLPKINSEIEGFYISKLNGYNSAPITDVLCTKSEVDNNKLIAELDKLGVYQCF